MDITSEQQGEFLEVRVQGRLDAYWADHLSGSLEEAVTGGAHRMRVEMSGVSYMSSVGLRVLVKFYKQLGAIGGSFHVTEPAGPVRNVIRMAGLETLLEPSSVEVPQRSALASAERIETTEAVYDIYDLAGNTPLTCQ